MQLDNVALIISIASFLGVILGPITTNLIVANQARIERRENQRKGHQDYLIGIMQSLIRLRADLQYLQGGDGRDRADREKAYGEAYGVMLSINDELIRQRAKAVMTGRFTEQGNEKLDAIDFAIQRLSDLIASND